MSLYFFRQALLGTLFLFLMTSGGAATVLFLRRTPDKRREGLIPGFAAGVMAAACIWSLLLPALAQSQGGQLPAWLPAAIGVGLGAGLLAVLDGAAAKGNRGTLLPAAITLHNIPEGMTVGLGFAMAGTAAGLTGAWALAIGIGIQNFPEGAAIALPLYQAGRKKSAAFLRGVLSGAVEPVFGMAAFAAAHLLEDCMPWLLSFAAGAMLYVVVAELLPQGKGAAGTAGFFGGFLLMMILDVSLG